MIGVRRSCETAANSVRRRALLAVEAHDHRVDVGGQPAISSSPRDAGADVARALADGGERRAHGVDVAQRAAADAAHRPARQRAA